MRAARLGGSWGRTALIALLVGVTATSCPALAVTGPETFGPGQVACQRLGEGQFDCLLTSLRISSSGNNVATFSLDTLPETERSIIQKWCSTAADDCTVKIQGTRQAPGSNRLVTVTSVRWKRLRPPRSEAAARAMAQ